MDTIEELSQEDVFANDVDPLDALREIRKEEASAELNEAADEEVSNNPQEETPEVDEIDEQHSEATEESDVESKEATDEVPNNLLKFKANGQDFEFTDEEVKEQFGTVFGKAMDYTHKMQKIAPYRKMISAMEEEGLTQEQFNLALDAVKGNKEALQQIMKDKEIDAFDLDASEEQDYTPTDYGKDEQQLAITEVVDKISNDTEYSITSNVVDEQWDSQSRDMLATNPEMIEGLHNDIKSGMYDKVSPLAMKMKVLDGNTKSDLEYYMMAGQQLNTTTEQPSVDDLNSPAQNAATNADKVSQEASKKRSASSTGTRSGKGVTDYLDDNDESFDAWYNELQSRN